MKKLYLLRHAQAQASSTGGDLHRHLTEKGISDAKALGAFMKKQGLRPEKILCSPATRTKETMECLGLEDSHIEFIKDIYESHGESILSHLQNTDHFYKSVIVIGHNPTLYEMVLRLSHDESSKNFLNQIQMGYHPATLSVLECPVENWSELSFGDNALVNIHKSDDYNGRPGPANWH